MPTPSGFNLKTASEWATVLSCLGGIATGVVYSIRWMISVSQAAKDIKSIKENHLPHIYYVLGLICRHLGIDYEGEGRL